MMLFRRTPNGSLTTGVTRGRAGVLLALSAGALLAFGSAGCKKISETLEAKVEEQVKQAAEAAQAAAESQADPDDLTADKLSNYISCLNGATRNVFDAEQRYTSWLADPKAGPTGKETHASHIGEVHSLSSCVSSLDEAKGKKPELADIETAAVGYRQALEKVAGTMKTAHAYYDQKDFKDDAFAKGKQLHPTLMADFAAFETANKLFDDKVVALNEQIAARKLEKLANEPDRKLEYLTRRTLSESKQLLKFADITKLEELDPKIDEKIATLAKSLEEIDDFTTKNPELAQKVSMYSSFTSQAKEFLKSAKELSRRKRENKDFNKEHLAAHNPSMVDGHPANVIDEYNDLIDRANNLRF